MSLKCVTDDKTIAVSTSMENSATLFTGTSTTLFCIAHSKHYSVSPDITWMRNSQPLLINNSFKFNVVEIKNGTEKQSILTVNNLTQSDAGEYVCKANSTQVNTFNSSLYLDISKF